MHRSIFTLSFAFLALSLLGCGGGGDSSGDSVPALATAQVVSGNNQTGVVAAELGSPLVARLLDGAGKPLVGYAVNFRVASGDGTLFAGTATSDGSGLVRERWTLGTDASARQSVEIRAVDVNGSAVVHATFHA